MQTLANLGLSARALTYSAMAAVLTAALWAQTTVASAAPIGDYTGITTKFTEEFGAALIVGLGIFGTIAAVVVGIRIIKRMMS